MRKIYVLLFICCFSMPSLLRAQQWVRSLENEDANFYQVQQEFNAYWQDKTEEKGKGYKQYKRWEWFWQQRVAPDGAFPDPGIVSTEWKEYKAREQQMALRRTQVANWQQLGPASSAGGYGGLGRINCMGFHPTDATTFWVGSAGGGLWKTTDGGQSWSSNTDQLPVLGISGIAVNYLNPSILYIATGDGINKYNSMGVMKSTDGGATWKQTALTWVAQQQGRISALVMHPVNPDILLAASRVGIYKTTNGGDSWDMVAAGWFTDLKYMPDNATVLATGRAEKGNQILRSTDHGTTWTKTMDLPDANRLVLAVTPADPTMVRVVASNGTNSGFEGLYTSRDAGLTFELTYGKDKLNLLHSSYNGIGAGAQGWYDLALAISPTNSEEIYVGGINTWKSVDGGKEWTLKTMWHAGSGASNVAVVHADKHYLGYHPLDNNTLFECNDGGLYKTLDGGSSWQDLSNTLQITQFYRVGVSATSSALLLAGAQDNGTKLRFGVNWRDVTGGDGMECVIDYSNPDIMYSSVQYGKIYRSMDGFKTQVPISNNIPDAPKGAWITPFQIDPVKPERLYAGYKNVYRSDNRGDTWTMLSTDLSQVELTYLKVAPSQPNTIYTGSGKQVFKTTDGGTTWQDMTAGLPVNQATITSLDVNPINDQNVVLTFSGYRDGAKVYMTNDGGITWQNMSGSLPNIPVNCVVFRDGGVGELFIGTDFGVFYKENTNADWHPFNEGLPNIMVMDLDVHHGENKLLAATYGRGVWVSDLSSANMPFILNFSPDNGEVGSDITITGSNFSGATQVKLNGQATIIKSVQQNTITVTVPEGATTGKLSITTATGTVETSKEFKVNSVTAIGDEVLEQKITLYPNPISAELQVKLNGVYIKSVAILSNLGAVIQTAGPRYTDFSMNLSALQPGLYFVRLETADGSFAMKRLVKL